MQVTEQTRTNGWNVFAAVLGQDPDALLTGLQAVRDGDSREAVYYLAHVTTYAADRLGLPSDDLDLVDSLTREITAFESAWLPLVTEPVVHDLLLDTLGVMRLTGSGDAGDVALATVPSPVEENAASQAEDSESPFNFGNSEDTGNGTQEESPAALDHPGEAVDVEPSRSTRITVAWVLAAHLLRRLADNGDWTTPLLHVEASFATAA